MRIRIVGLFFLVLFFSVVSTVFAQVDSIGVATPIVIEGDVQAGDIICSREGGHVVCSEQYDPSILGVVTESPPAAFESTDFPDVPLVISSGDAIVRVSTINGEILEGDLVTSSDIPGVGQKVTVNGFVLGTAMEGFTSEDTTAIGEILVSLNVHPSSSFVGSRSNLVANIRQALSSPVVAPLDSFRYLLAFIIALISFALGFIYFGRVVRSGVEAIGRNPLASRVIQATIIVNIVVTIVIVLTGLGVALLILVI